MKSHAAAIIFSLLQILLPLQARAQEPPQAAAAWQQEMEIERDENATAVPLIPHMGKLAIEATMGGIERQFIFDTGSPTMISRELAEKLGLEIIGSNTGRDANGRLVTTDIGIVDQLKIGGVTFNSVPVLIADFGQADPDGCFFDGGVIGSEIFPGSVWHIDGDKQVLQIARSLSDLMGPETVKSAMTVPLHDLGYPHAPVFDYAVGEFSDKGLFDTGNSDTIVLFDRVAQDAQVRSAMIPGTIRAGRGSHGVSAAGADAESDLLRFEMEGMRLGEVKLARHSGTTRNAPPSLIGLGILDSYDVTLDYPGAQILLHSRGLQVSAPSHPGYGIMRKGAEVRVVQLFEGSAAQRAGLKLGDTVVALDDRNLTSDLTACETARWLAETRPTRSARQLTVVRDGRHIEIDLSRQ